MTDQTTSGEAATVAAQGTAPQAATDHAAISTASATAAPATIAATATAEVSQAGPADPTAAAGAPATASDPAAKAATAAAAPATAKPAPLGIDDAVKHPDGRAATIASIERHGGSIMRVRLQIGAHVTDWLKPALVERRAAAEVDVS